MPDAPLPSDPFAPMDRIEERLRACASLEASPGALGEAVRYSLLGAGKRLRPVLAWHCCEACGGRGEASLGAGAAVELIHAFSLVHDDLPAIDNDDTRRGKPTLHRHAGEAMAILTGDAMMAIAFRELLGKSPDAALGAALAGELARATTAMIDGQVWDTLGGLPDGLSRDEQLRLIHTNKTGALIAAACRMGARCALGADAERDGRYAAIASYGDTVGLLFQAVDDLLDVTQSAEHTGKRTGKDAPAGKLTYPGVHSVDGTLREIESLRAKAEAAVAPLGPNSAVLRELANFLASRTK
ncbi:MAG TPA: polyprenyl synthetase family protein [Phycisphaerales bacterium]|nr:polyprenyl synthetase family protein [Phycisphaerales bacterium]